ncbi:MAG: hypothetical protein WEC34_08035 [Acidimicrobiia bacterium]
MAPVELSTLDRSRPSPETRRRTLKASRLALTIIGASLILTIIGVLALSRAHDGPDIAANPSPTNPRPVNPMIDGRLLDGRTWTLRHDQLHGLCLTIGTQDFGCDDVGPVINPNADPATPREAVEPGPFPNPNAGLFAYAYLPPGATNVVLIFADGRTTSAGLVIEPTARFWGMPIKPGDNPPIISYTTADGTEIARFP